ncbi:MAG: hypothetical protein R2814_03020 [Flavobacteriaceae bacterium]
MLYLVSLTTFLLFCLSCRERMGEQQGTTPSKSAVPNRQKENMERAEPEKAVPQRNNNIPTKSKNGQKSRSRDTLTPKMALS